MNRGQVVTGLVAALALLVLAAGLCALEVVFLMSPVGVGIALLLAVAFGVGVNLLARRSRHRAGNC
jgi:hypothetical protein